LPYEDGGPCNACQQDKRVTQLEKTLAMFVERLKGQEVITDKFVAVAKQLAAMGRHYEFCASNTHECGVCDCGWSPAFAAWAYLSEQRRAEQRKENS
jgi:hypothetical protein